MVIIEGTFYTQKIFDLFSDVCPPFSIFLDSSTFSNFDRYSVIPLPEVKSKTILEVAHVHFRNFPGESNNFWTSRWISSHSKVSCLEKLAFWKNSDFSKNEKVAVSGSLSNENYSSKKVRSRRAIRSLISSQCSYNCNSRLKKEIFCLYFFQCFEKFYEIGRDWSTLKSYKGGNVVSENLKSEKSWND